MEMKPVKSSQIHAIGYDPATKQMRVQFLQGKDRQPGAIYEYDSVTPEQHSALIGADSIGRHFGAHIKGNAAIKFRRMP
jgi:hypothetical protein